MNSDSYQVPRLYTFPEIVVFVNLIAALLRHDLHEKFTVLCQDTVGALLQCYVHYDQNLSKTAINIISEDSNAHLLAL